MEKKIRKSMLILGVFSLLAYGVAQGFLTMVGYPFWMQDIYFRGYHTLLELPVIGSLTHILPAPPPRPMGYLDAAVN